MLYLYLNVFLPPVVFLCDSIFHVWHPSIINVISCSTFLLLVGGGVHHTASVTVDARGLTLSPVASLMKNI